MILDATEAIADLETDKETLRVLAITLRLSRWGGETSDTIN